MLERLLGPLNLVTTPAGHTLRHLARQSLSRRLFHHYRGFLAGMRREYEREAAAGVRTAKRLLYAYRVALTGIHALLAGEIETRVDVLAEALSYAWGGRTYPDQAARRASDTREAEATPHWLRSSVWRGSWRKPGSARCCRNRHQTRRRWSFVVEVRLHRLCGGGSAGGALAQTVERVISLHDEKVCYVFVGTIQRDR